MIEVTKSTDVVEEIKGLIETLKSLNKKKVLVCGRPEQTDDFKNLVEQWEEMFSEYEFYYYSSENFEVTETVYLVPYEERTKPLFVYLNYNETEEEK